MPRPGFVADIDRSSPPVVFHHGDRLRLEHLPAGRSRVIYSPEPSAVRGRSDLMVAAALAEPLGGSEPLAALLRPGMKLTVAFDDLSTPLPSMRAPEARQRIVEEVLEQAAAAGVDDVVLLAAIGLRRRMTSPELRHLLGERAHDAFASNGLLAQHDAEDPDGLVAVGATAAGHPVELNRRAAESDLLVYVHVHQPGWHPPARHSHEAPTPTSQSTSAGPPGQVAPGAGWGWRALLEGLSSHATLQGGFQPEMGEVLERSGPRTFAVVATLGGDPYTGPLAVLGKREWEWSPRDKATFAAMRTGLDLLPAGARQKVQGSWRAPLRIASVHAGAMEPAHSSAAAEATARQLVPVEGQTDIVTMGLPGLSPFSVGSCINPVLVRWLGLACFGNLHAGKPLVREGGVVIMSHPTRREFDPVHHPSYLDFFERVLPEVVAEAQAGSQAGAQTEGETNAALDRHEKAFATDEWYRHLYRTSYAFHGAHPFGVWRQASRALARLGRVIVVGGDPAAVHRMGMRSASTLGDAFELASDVVGADATITHLHSPPLLTADVS